MNNIRKVTLTVLVLLLTIPSLVNATQITTMSVPELIGRSDLVVTGTVTEEEGRWNIQVSEVLKGPEVKTVPFDNTPLPHWPPPVKEGDRGIFFLCRNQSYKDIRRAQAVKMVVQMLTDPKPYLDLEQYPENFVIIKVLSMVFSDVNMKRAGTLTRKEAILYLRERLGSSNVYIITSAIDALIKMRDYESFSQVLALLSHEDKNVALWATIYLRQFPNRLRNPNVIKILCGLLDAQSLYYPQRQHVSLLCAEIIGSVEDPAMLPYLERAARYGVLTAVSALGVRGRTESFEIILTTSEKQMSNLNWYSNALKTLVSRSNKKFEPWMNNFGDLKTMQAWRRWWNANKGKFKVIKPQADAVR